MGGYEQNDSTSFFQSKPKLCINGCGVFGTPAYMNICSKCYHDLKITQEASIVKSLNLKPKTSFESVLASSSSTNIEMIPQNTAKTRCNRKVGFMGFKCKCGNTFCSDHRYPENHECEFDFRVEVRDAIGKANPLLKGEKVERF
ncbi:hypothetical protein N665_0090s0025 [Sinapis alba]|nr:hypothetical protein N665_0090s0025 [Sinapis alba]